MYMTSNALIMVLPISRYISNKEQTRYGGCQCRTVYLSGSRSVARRSNESRCDDSENVRTPRVDRFRRLWCRRPLRLGKFPKTMQRSTRSRKYSVFPCVFLTCWQRTTYAYLVENRMMAQYKLCSQRCFECIGWTERGSSPGSSVNREIRWSVPSRLQRTFADTLRWVRKYCCKALADGEVFARKDIVIWTGTFDV